MRISYDDEYLFSAAADGSLFCFKVVDKEGRRYHKDKDTPFAEEVLITKSDMEEKVHVCTCIIYGLLCVHYVRICQNQHFFYCEYTYVQFITLNIQFGNINGRVTKCCSSLMVGTIVDAHTCNSDIIDANYSKISILMESAKCCIFPYPITYIVCPLYNSDVPVPVYTCIYSVVQMSQMSDLRSRVTELKSENEYKVRLQDMNYQEKIKLMDDSHTQEVEALRAKYEVR